MTPVTYTEDTIRTLDWKEHIRKRPGMYIGKLGDGSSQDDGIYVLLKEVLDNAIDEFMMGFGSRIDITINEDVVQVRDFGRGIPLGKVLDVASRMNTGAKYDSKVFKKSVGLNGVGIKAVNALSSYFEIRSFREGMVKAITFSEGILQVDAPEEPGDFKNGTLVSFVPDHKMFGNFTYLQDYLEAMIKNYIYLNSGLTIYLNGTPYFSKDGLIDLLRDNVNGDSMYPIIQLKDEDIELALTHGTQYGEIYYTFVNGQHTTQGGTHLTAFKEALVKTIRDFYKKDFDPSDIRSSMVTALSLKVEEPVFESQTKTKLGSKEMTPDGVSIRNFIGDFLKKHLDNYLHKHTETADILLKKIIESEKERKAISGIQKLARERAKKSNLHNKKLRDCKIHLTDNDERRLDSTIFITEGDSASGSITTTRDVATQAVFSLKGKPLNCFGLTKKIVYENEEFNLLQAALNIEDGYEYLRYNNIIVATDADVDGMHIRMLLMTFFLQFFPELVRQGHLYILQTPLFRVRNKKATHYCYTPEEKETALKKVGAGPEITRFKGLGEISPEEFKHFIGKDMRLDPVRVKKGEHIQEILPFFMGKNSPERQDFIIDNLRIEEDLVEEVR
jgi:topoisomerase IV subunit B